MELVEFWSCLDKAGFFTLWRICQMGDSTSMVKHKDAATLHQIFKDYVEDETTIFIDWWPSYIGLLGVNGYKHYTVNHSEHFVETKPREMTRHEEEEAIRIIVNDFEEAGDDAMDDEEQQDEKVVDVHTQKVEMTLAWSQTRTGQSTHQSSPSEHWSGNVPI